MRVVSCDRDVILKEKIGWWKRGVVSMHTVSLHMCVTLVWSGYWMVEAWSCQCAYSESLTQVTVR